jgi:hypothetical protein
MSGCKGGRGDERSHKAGHGGFRHDRPRENPRDPESGEETTASDDDASSSWAHPARPSNHDTVSQGVQLEEQEHLDVPHAIGRPGRN